MTRVSNVNSRDIRDAVELACRCMCLCLAPDDRDIPYWRAIARPEAYLGMPQEHEQPGRCLPPLLMAESYLGLEIDEDCVDKLARAAFMSYGDGPLPLPLSRKKDDNFEVADKDSSPITMMVHNNREGMYALWSLTKFRHSDRAQELGAASVDTILNYWEPEDGWDYERLEREQGVDSHKPRTFINGLGRAIGAITRFYEATGYGPALELALLLKEKSIGQFFLADGSYGPERFGTHGHSTTSAMCSLAQLADLTRDSHLMGRVKKFYDNGLWDMRDQLGWSIENGGASNASPDTGEMNNTGDILETAMIFGRWGYTEYYHDAERIIRGYLLPSQLRDVSWIEEPPNPDNLDGRRDVANRLLGSWGFAAPYGHEQVETGQSGGRIRFNLDVIGGAAKALCWAYEGATRYDEAGHHVNLLFDHETDHIRVESRYTNSTLGVTVKAPGPLFVRVPPWVDRNALRVQGVADTPRHTNGYLLISRPPVNRRISFELGLPIEEISLAHRSRQIRTRLQGDEVIAMDNFGADLTFFDPFD